MSTRNPFVKALSLALFLSSPAVAQTGLQTVYFQPSTLSAGQGAAELRMYRDDLTADMMLRWNGQLRPTRSDNTNTLIVSLTADDLAQPGLAEITAYDTASDTVSPRINYIAVGYSIKPLGTAYDAKRKRLYIAMGDESGDIRFPPHSVIALDPETATIGPIVDPGATLGPLALSDDASALYVVVNGTGMIRKLDPSTLATLAEFRLRASGAGSFGFIETAVAVMPGKPDTVAVNYHPDVQSSLAKLAVFDGGIKRAKELNAFGGIDAMMFSPDGHYVFAGSFNVSSAVMFRYSVDSSGVPDQVEVRLPAGAPVTVLDGVLYTTGGKLLRVDSLQPVGNLDMAGPLAVDPENRRLLVVNMAQVYPNYPEYLQAFDLATQQQLGWQQIHSTDYFDANGETDLRLYRFGRDGLIYRSSTHLIVFRTPLAGPAPLTIDRAIVHGASQVGGAIAPGQILSIYGTDLGPEAPAVFSVAGGKIASTLANVQVWFDQTPGIMLLAWKNQINVIAPLELPVGKTVRVQVWNLGIPSARIPMSVVSAAPGLFTRDGSGKGFVSVINQDGSVNTASPPGSVAALYATGGQAPDGATDGQLAHAAQPIPGTVRVTIAGRDAKVWYAGAAPGLVHGVFQLNVEVPAATPKGAAAITVEIDGHKSVEGASLEIR